jgi:biopolymer transport protein ExbD
MKQLLAVLLMAFAVSAHAVDSRAADVARADAAKETKQVCVDVKKDGKEVKDSKTGKTKQNCKQVRQHKKLEVEKK